MKFIFLLFFSASLLIVSCEQTSNDEKKKPAEDSLLGKSIYDIDTLEFPKGYIVKSEKSIFFDYPDSSSQRNDFLLKDDFLQVSAISNGFAYGMHPVSSDSSFSGWVFLNTLESISFTPPKGAIMDSAQ